jgi:ferredoxin
MTSDAAGRARVIDAAGLGALIAALAGAGYEVIGPQRRDQAIVYEPLEGLDDLPRGWVDEQAPGHYRLKREGDAYFGHVVGPHSWKRFLHPPHQRLWSAEKTPDGAAIRAEPVAAEKYAFIGVRACELAAIAIQDRVFMEGPYVDPHYAARRKNAFIVAINCGRAAETCFCSSMNTGPKAKAGFDLALTEIATGAHAAFLIESGSKAGESFAAKLNSRAANKADHDAAAKAVAKAESDMVRRIDTDGLPALLKAKPNHPRWDEVAARCLNCANCTMACPTCFCTSVEDLSAVDGSSTERRQRWDSCFTADFSHIHGGAVRPSGRARYRQWMTHKLATWHDQFGTSGCVGCGRCITWCPVGIDITEEAAAIRGAA